MIFILYNRKISLRLICYKRYYILIDYNVFYILYIYYFVLIIMILRFFKLGIFFYIRILFFKILYRFEIK